MTKNTQSLLLELLWKSDGRYDMKKSNCMINGNQPRYRIRLRIGTNANGAPVYKSFYGRSKSEAQKMRDDFLKSQNSGPNAGKNESLLQLADYYTYNVFPKENLSYGTIELYERQYRNIVSKQTFCVKPVREIRTSDLQLFFNSLPENSVTQATVKFMRRLFKWLKAEGYCDNLMSSVAIRNKPTSHLNASVSVFSEEEVQSITRKENRLQFLFILAFASRMRLGELLSIRYSDFTHDSVTISKQLNEHYVVRPDHTYHESSIIDTKTQSSRRTIPLPESVMQHLELHKQKHRQEMMKFGYRTDFLFTSKTGRLLSKGNFRRAWIRHLKSCGVPYRKFHSCRATYCTMLCQQGVPLETASKLMGHSDVSVTAKYYRLISSQELRDAADKIGAILDPVGDNLAISNKK